MSTPTVLFDIPGPAGPPAPSGSGRSSAASCVLALIGLALWRLGSNGQLDPARWAVLFDPNSGVPQALGKRAGQHAQVAAVAMVAATLLGALLAVGRLSDHRWVRRAGHRGDRVLPRRAAADPDPVLPAVPAARVGIRIGPFGALALGLTLYNMAVLAEIFRAGILSVDRGQREAAFALGMRKSQVMTLVLLPQAVRRMLPVLIAQLVVLLKDSSLGFIVGYFELLRQARSLVEFFNSKFGDLYTFQLYVAAAVIYIVVNLLLSALARYVERRTRRNTKAAATAEVELPADVQMGGGGGAVPV